jgi:hypothetical protein
LLINRIHESVTSARRDRLVLSGMKQSGDPLPTLANSDPPLPKLEQSDRPVLRFEQSGHRVRSISAPFPLLLA